MKANQSIEVGAKLIYNDGRAGHSGVVCEVLAVGDNAMVVQFEDRASTNTIRFHDRAWMDYLTVKH